MSAAEDGAGLRPEEVERYARQLVLPEWSEEVQLRLRAARALVIGAGALGSPAAQYLVAAGVGTVGVVDADDVELSNLARQVLHYTPDVGVPKAASAVAKLRFLNPLATVEPYRARVDEDNAATMVLGQDVVLDCTDTAQTRYLVNAACCAAGVPLVEAGAQGLEGLVLAIRPGVSACYRCAFPDPPVPDLVASCAEAGVLGPVAGIVGTIQALEAIKLLTGVAEPATDAILRVDGRGPAIERIATARRSDCADCGAVA